MVIKLTQSADEFTQRIENVVIKARNKEEWRLEYMTLLQRDREKFEEGVESGKEIGEENAKLKIARSMFEKNMSLEDIKELTDVTLDENGNVKAEDKQ